MLVVRVDASSDLLWAKVFASGNEDDVLYSGVELPTGEFLVVGGAGSVLKLDASGGLVWSRTYGLEEIRKIAPTPDGDFVMVGRRTTGSVDVAELIVIDAAGEIVLRASYGGAGITYRFFAVASLDDGGYLAAGEINGPGFSDLYGWLARLDAAGNIVWQRHMSDAGAEVHSVASTADGGFVLGGHTGFFPHMMVARVSSTGESTGCSHPTTLASKTASDGSFTADTRTVIDPPTLVVGDSDKPLVDSATPQNQTVCQGGPTFPPSEVSPPAASASPLLFLDSDSLEWEAGAPSSSTSFDLYRGGLAALRAGVGPDCLIRGLATSGASDGDSPVPGQAFVYVVGGRNVVGTGTLGHASDGSERQPATPCN